MKNKIQSRVECQQEIRRYTEEIEQLNSTVDDVKI